MGKISSLSCIVPAYNAAVTIAKCVDSICASSVEDIEIIIVDDGSTDDTRQIVEHICQSKENEKVSIRYVHIENSGVSIARNTGISMATKRWIMFVDADDCLVNHWGDEFDYDEESMGDNDIIMFTYERTSAMRTDRSTSSYNAPVKGKTFKVEEPIRQSWMKRAIGFYEAEPRNGVPARNSFAKIFAKEFLTRNTILFPVGVKNGEDLIFMLCCYEKANKMSIVDMSVYNYYLNPSSLTQRFKPDIIEITELFFQNLRPIIVRHPELQHGYDASMVNNYFLEMGSFLFHKQNAMSIDEKQKYYMKRIPYYQASCDQCGEIQLSLLYKIILKLLQRRMYKASFHLWVLRTKIRDLVK